MEGMSRVINEQPSGKLGTKVQTLDMAEMGIGNGIDARNATSVGKSEGENYATNLGKIQGK